MKSSPLTSGRMKDPALKYFVIYKPYGVISQFTDKLNRPTLAGLFNFPDDVYPVGRLDMDSEGLLLLTNDKQLTDYLLNPKFKLEKEYCVQVEGIPPETALDSLRRGVVIENKLTLPAVVKKIKPPGFPPRVPPVRERKTVPDCWLSITIVEGRNRQVRKMTAKIGYPTLRLIRVRIKNFLIDGMQPSMVRELTDKEVNILKERGSYTL